MHFFDFRAPRPKKGGFVITNVKDYIDGDESADDLDESHAYDESHSDISYSLTTNIDHDQESSASEDTLNITLQDSIQHGGIPTFTSSSNATSISDMSSSTKSLNKPIMTMQVLLYYFISFDHNILSMYIHYLLKPA